MPTLVPLLVGAYAGWGRRGVDPVTGKPDRRSDDNEPGWDHDDYEAEDSDADENTRHNAHQSTRTDADAPESSEAPPGGHLAALSRDGGRSNVAATS